MNATELRIGNWIIHPKNGEWAWRFSRDDWDYCEMDEFNPIPITPEWLERAGFKRDEIKKGEMSGFIAWRHPDYIDIMEINNPAWVLPIGYYLIIGSTYLNAGNPIFYINHLQNCQKDLTGKELEFNV